MKGKEIAVAEFKVGDRVKVLDKSNWPDEGYKIGNWEGTVIQVVEDPAGYVTVTADKRGYDMLFHEKKLEKIQPDKHAEQTSDHDGTLGLIDALQQKTNGNSSVDVRLDM
jgi:hypothetical protein